RERAARGGAIYRLSITTAAGLLVTALAAPAPPAATSLEPGRDFMRGMVVSCPTWGPIWGSPLMAESLAEIRQLGVEWIAIHPYAGVLRNGTIRITPAESTGFLERAVKLTREAGMKLFWKPHLAYWGSFDWRGDIAFGADEAAWRRFFDGYREFIIDQARFAERAGAELFAVGVETDATTLREGEWRRIVAAVRQVYTGKITYAANWDNLQGIGFWDAVDVIGVHAYFPLAYQDSPDAETLRRGWDAPLESLQRLADAEGGKPVVFAEIGYNRSPDAARRPWEYEIRDSAETRALRKRLIEVALARLEAEPLVHGLFWWKWIPGDDRFDRDFSMRDPEAREALSRHWPVAR
ncbi:MAG: hypothetical protein ACE5EG_07035, partial [Thermoanaerobaculia bacterium]